MQTLSQVKDYLHAQGIRFDQIYTTAGDTQYSFNNGSGTNVATWFPGLTPAILIRPDATPMHRRVPVPCGHGWADLDHIAYAKTIANQLEEHITQTYIDAFRLTLAPFKLDRHSLTFERGGLQVNGRYANHLRIMQKQDAPGRAGDLARALLAVHIAATSDLAGHVL